MNSSDLATSVWYAGNQPYGYNRVGNPLIKSIGIILMMVGVSAQVASIVFWGVAITLFILYIPFNQRSRIGIISVHIGLGSLLVFVTNPMTKIIPYNTLQARMQLDVPHVAVIDGLFVLSALSMMITLFMAYRAFTSRDLALLVDLVPTTRGARNFFANWLFSYAYSAMRVPSILIAASISLRSRGIGKPRWWKLFYDPSGLADDLGPWILYFIREMREMVHMIDYLIRSRMRPSRRPWGKVFLHWSTTDLSMAGAFLVSGLGGPLLSAALETYL